MKGKVKNMKTFEVGKRYNDGAMVFEITARTEKTIKFITIQHAGRFNERKSEEKKARINKWENREVFFYNYYQIEA